LLSGWVQRRHDKKLRKREQIDKIGGMMIECASWFHTLYSCREEDKLLELRPPFQLASIVLSARLSFPALVPHAQAFRDESARHYNTVLVHFDKQIPMTAGGQIEAICQRDDQFRQKMDNLRKVREAFEDAIVAEAKKLGDL